MTTTTALITDVTEARKIAALYQSSGTIGRTLAAFVSGAKLSRYRLNDDIKATQRQLVMQAGTWEELERLSAWVLSNDDHVLIGPPHEGIRVLTNHQPRTVLCWHDLTDEERERFDYYPSDDPNVEATFVRYRGWTYDLDDTDGLAPSALAKQGWSTYASDSFFSGTVFRFFDEDGSLIDGGDSVIVGRYFTD